MGKPDAVVVGGGAVGLCCACALAREGMRVLLLERKRPGAGASWGNAGLVAPSRSVPLAEPGIVRRGLRWMLDPTSPLYVPLRADVGLIQWLWRFRKFSTAAHLRRSLPLLVGLQRWSLRLYRELEGRGLDFGFRTSGTLAVFQSSRELASFLGEVDLLRSHGIPAEVLGPDAALQREPLLRPQLAGAVYFPEDAYLDPARLVESLAAYAGELGVEIRNGAAGQRLWRRGGEVSVEVGDSFLHPATVVVAAGAWSAPLLRTAGVRIPVLPAKGYAITLPHAAPPGRPLMLSEARVAVTPLRGPGGEARVRLAGTLELGVAEEGINHRRVLAIRRAASRYLDLDPSGGEVWAGLRPCTPDGLPVVGRPRGFRNLVVATGHGTLGISLAPVTGELVASLVAGRPLQELDPLSPDRFC
ncbi:MAG: FAD-dependent oxidoreductase [Armatimonadota bacterium]|nr:FAD-dependent oxidoreductase [Armatimonadota bacterium]MDR7444589.1 FAD-dependent oxidoreductase [Armatimonadota bacterium]MDR7570245.1 FAD-dependent oxidoreductase [Armatimonadota bacterium]MDR7615559.1 FAD-dependent oxidoreductase [Armatimonadota bacterium]